MKASSIADPKKVRKDVPDLEEAIEEEDEGEVVEAAETIEDMDMDIKGDKYIKQPKAKANGKKTAKKAAKDADEEDGEDSQPVKGRGKGKGAGRGRPAKK